MGILFACLVSIFPAQEAEEEPDRWVPSESERERSDPANELWPSRPDPRGVREGSDLLADDLIKALLKLAREPKSALDFTPRRYGPPPRVKYERQFKRTFR